MSKLSNSRDGQAVSLPNHQNTYDVNTFASDVRKENFRIRPAECVFRITSKVGKISDELDCRLHLENIQFIFSWFTFTPEVHLMIHT